MNTVGSSDAVHAAVQRLVEAGESTDRIATATGVDEGRVQKIGTRLEEATLDETCRLVGYLAYLVELLDEFDFESLHDVAEWMDAPLASTVVVPRDLVAAGEFELVCRLAEHRHDQSGVGDILEASGLANLSGFDDDLPWIGVGR